MQLNIFFPRVKRALTGAVKVSTTFIVKKIVNKFGSLVNNSVVCTVQSNQSN